MPDKFALPEMPPLTPDMHREVEGTEYQLRLARRGCGDAYSFDEHKAYEKLRTFAVELFDIYYGFHSQYPQHKRSWFMASRIKATLAALHCIPSGYALDVAVHMHYDERLFKTIEAHFRSRPKTGPKEVAVVFTKSKSKARTESLVGQLECWRKECRLTQQQMADALEIDVRNVARHLSGQSTPRARHVEAYEKLFSEKSKKSVRLGNNILDRLKPP